MSEIALWIRARKTERVARAYICEPYPPYFLTSRAINSRFRSDREPVSPNQTRGSFWYAIEDPFELIAQAFHFRLQIDDIILQLRVA
jgi:hypothetical protein